LTPAGVLDPATAPIPGDSLGNREPRSLVAPAVRLLPLDLLTKQFELLVTPRALLAQESDLFLAPASLGELQEQRNDRGRERDRGDDVGSAQRRAESMGRQRFARSLS